MSPARRASGGAPREAGNALILVIVSLAALIAIATPFALSMRMHERSARGFAAGVRAGEAARAGRELAVQRLIAGTPGIERLAAGADGTLDASGEDVDDLDELAVTATALPGASAMRLDDARGTQVSVAVEDEQGKANLNSASGLLLGNILGVASLAADVDAGSKELPLEGDAPFYSDGRRDTLDGLLLVGGELIAYRHIEAGVVSGLERGAFFSAPDPRILVHRKGELVHDARGWKLAEHPFWVEMGGYRPYIRVAGAREIASWQLVDLTLANLFRRGVTPEVLQEYGLGGEALRAMGAARTLERVSREAEEARARGDAAALASENPSGAAAARREGVEGAEGADGAAGATATAEAPREREREGEEDDDPPAAGAPRREAPEDPEAAAERIARRAESGRGGDAAAAVDGALRRMGRSDGKAWLDKVMRAVGSSQGAAAKAFAKQALERLRQLEEHERAYYKDQREQAERVADARDLEALSARELEQRLRPYVTAASTRPGEWAAGALVVNPVDFDPMGSVTTLVLGVDVPEAAAGLACRVDTPDRGPVYRRIAAYRRANPRRPAQLALFPQLEGSYEAGTLRAFVAPAHPVNVNTAPRRLLEALLTGLETGFMSQTQGAVRDFVTPSEAALVAARIVGAPIAEHRELLGVLDAAVSAGEISPMDRLAILLNAMDPGHPQLRGRTLPFCYRGGEVATVLSSGVANDPAGNELARKVVRDVVAVSPPRGATVHLDSQADLFTGFDDPRGVRRQTLRAGRRGNLMESFPVSLRATDILRGPRFWPSRSHAPGQGEVRLLTSEVEGDEDWGARSTVVCRHFRDDPEGKKIEAGGGGLVEASGPIVANVPPFTGVVVPGHFEAWFRPEAPDAFQLFFDTGPDTDDRNRIAVWFDPDARELVLEVSDAALDVAEAGYLGRGPRKAELRAPHRFDGNRWTHIAASWRGTRAGDLALFVDGRSVGKQRTVTRLAADIDASATSIPLEDGSFFPVRGAARVGGEMIDYDNTGGAWRDGRLGGNTLLVSAMRDVIDPTTGQPTGQQERAPRVGRPRAHRRGTPVEVAGYTDPLGIRLPDPRSGVPGIRGRIPPGPCTLALELPSPTAKARVYPTPQQLTSDGFLGIKAGDTDIPVASADEPFPPNDGIIQIGSELIRYGAAAPANRPDRFTGCQRGYGGTTASDHYALEHVVLCDVRVAPGTASFDANTRYVQLSTPSDAPSGVDPRPEWVAVRWLSPPTPERFVLDNGDMTDRQSGVGDGGVRVPPGTPWPAKAQYEATPTFQQWKLVEISRARGQHGTEVRPHVVAERAIGAFLTQWGNHGRLDWVTVVEAGDPATRIERRIAWSSGGWAAFTDFVPKAYEFPTARLVKRPSGELPTWASNFVSIGARRPDGASGGAPGTVVGRVDEPRLARDDATWLEGEQNGWNNVSAYGALVLAGVAPRWLGAPITGSGGGAVPVAVESRRIGNLPGGGAARIPPNPGAIAAAIGQAGGRTGLLVKVDDEVLAFGRGGTNQVDLTERGLLGTQADIHSDEAVPYVLPFPALARLAGGFGGGLGEWVPASGIRRRALAGAGPGYLALDRGGGQGLAEFLPYDRLERDQFRRPVDDRLRGAYRGSFGTERDTPLAEGRVAIVHPFRHFDRHDPTIESDDATFWQASVAPAGAAHGPSCLFETIEWDEERVLTEVGPVILARIDGKPAWNTPPTNEPGGIFRFDDPRKESRIDVAGRALEVRVVIPFKPGAYLRGAWKETARVGGVRVRYLEPVRTFESEDLMR
jgi:type II secretory pathway component PulK